MVLRWHEKFTLELNGLILRQPSTLLSNDFFLLAQINFLFSEMRFVAVYVNNLFNSLCMLSISVYSLKEAYIFSQQTMSTNCVSGTDETIFACR